MFASLTHNTRDKVLLITVVTTVSLLIPFLYILLPVVVSRLSPNSEVAGMLAGEPFGETFLFALAFSMPLYTDPLLTHFAMGSGLVAYWMIRVQERKDRLLISLTGFGAFAAGGMLLSVISEGEVRFPDLTCLVCSFQAVAVLLMAHYMPYKLPITQLKPIYVLSRTGIILAAVLAGYALLWLNRYILPLHLSLDTSYALLGQALQHPPAVWIALLLACLSTIVPGVLVGGFYPCSAGFERGCAAAIAGGITALLLAFNALEVLLTGGIPAVRWKLFSVYLVILAGCIWTGAWLGIQLYKHRIKTGLVDA